MSGNEKDNNDDYKPPGIDTTVDVDVLPAGVEPASISGNHDDGNDNLVQQVANYMMDLIRMILYWCCHDQNPIHGRLRIARCS